jgi:O-antigen ligase
MFTILIALVIARPFISSLAYTYIDFAYTSVTILCIILLLTVKKPPIDNLKTALFPLIFFGAALCISLIGSLDTATSLLELFKVIPCILIFIAAASFDETQRKTLIFAIVYSCIAVCTLALYQYLVGFKHFQNYLTHTGINSPLAKNYLSSKRVFYPFVTPNALAGYLALVAPLCLSEKRLYWTSAPIIVVLLLTQSIGALLALGAGVYLCMILLSSKFKPGRVALLTGLAALFVIIFWLRISMQAPDAHDWGLLRLQYWHDTWAIILSHPFFGIGLGNIYLKGSMFSHNAYLQMGAETGLAGLAGFVWVCITVLRRGIRRFMPQRPFQISLLICSCVIFLIHNLFDFTFSLPEVSFIWWALMGLLIAA